MSNKLDSDYMNEILDRLGIADTRAITATLAAPTFARVFSALIDRIEELERTMRVTHV